MRTLSATLTTAQKNSSQGIPQDHLAKIVLTKTSQTTQTYTTTRILDIDRHEGGGVQTAEVLLDNSDGALTSLDLRGYTGTISGGFTTSAGDEYSAISPLTVIAQQLYSAPGLLSCRLSLAGAVNLMGEDHASADYTQESDDTNTVKDLIQKIVGDTGITMLACFNHCTAIDCVFDSEDALIDVFQPKDSFSIKRGDTRESKKNELLRYTGCVDRMEDDGKLHIFVPTTTGTSYDYEYSYASGEHTFFNKRVRERIVIPNKIQVDSHPAHEDAYTGSATDATSYALLPITNYYYLRVSSDAQATAISTAILGHHQWEAEQGYGEVPINVGAEEHDYVKITDSRQSDSRVGNIGYLRSHYTQGQWNLSFGFGSPIQRGLAGTLPPGAGGGGDGWDIDLSDIWDFLNYLDALMQQILDWIKNYRCPYEGYITIGPLEDIILTPGYDAEAGDNRYVTIAGQLCMLKDKAFGLLLAETAGAIDWYTKGGTLHHVLAPDTDGYGYIGGDANRFKKGQFKIVVAEDELYIPSEE